MLYQDFILNVGLHNDMYIVAYIVCWIELLIDILLQLLNQMQTTVIAMCSGINSD